MSSNNEFPIPFEDSRRGLAANQEEKAAVGRLGQYLASRGVNRPTIGEGRKRRRLGNIELPTGGKPGKRKPTGSRMDVDGDGWADEGTTKPVWVGIDGQGKKPKQGTEGPKPSSSSSKRKLSSGFYNLIAIETDESTPEKLESLKEQLGDALVSHETSTVDIGARGQSNVRKKHTFRIDNSGLRNTYAHNYATNRGFVAQIEAAPSETRLSSGMTQLSEVEVYNYGKLKAAKKVRSTQPKGKEQDYWIVLGIDGDVRAYSASVVEEKRKKLLDNFNQQGENPFNGKKSPLSIDDIDMQDVLRGALDDQKIKIIASMETWDVEDRNEVFQINTRDGHRRRGIAAEMFNTHREVFPERDLQHSDALSEDGKAFSAATPATSVSGRFSSGRDINAKLNLERYGDNEESAYVSSFEIGSKKFSVSRGGDSPGRNMYNGYLVAFDENGKNVGYIDYNSDSVDKTATVAMTEVTEEYKRMGIASALLDSLLIDFPDYEISPGYTTDEGAAWWRRVTGSDGPIRAERKTRLSSGATARRVGARNVYDKSVDYNDKRNPSGLLETSRDGKEYSSIRFNGDGYDIKTSQSEDGFSVFIEDESGQIASLVFSEAPTGEATKLLSYKASKESQKAGVLEALLDHVLVKNPDTNITSTAETRRWLQYVNNGTADYGVKGFRKYGFSGKYIDGEDVLRDGDYTLESDLLLKTSNVSSSPVASKGFSENEYIWEGQVYKIGNESIVFGAHEEAEFGDGIKKLPLNPFEILNLDPSSTEGRKAAKKWYSAVHGADVSVLAESSDFNASSYVSALLYAASKGDKDAQKEFDEFAKYSDSLLEKIDSKLSPVENPEKALSLDSRLVHQTSYKPTIDEKGYLVLRPLEDFPQTAKDGTEVTVNRTTLHFAINHLAEGHMFRKETGGESYVVISSLDSFIKQNPDSLENFNIVDTAASPPPGDGLRFAPGSYKLVEVKEGEDGRKKVEDILRADGVEVLVGGERNSGTPGADEAGRIRARMLGVSPSVASDLTLANLEQINRTNISDQRQYADVPSSTSFFQEASKNALLRIANRKENTWVSTSRKLNDKDPLGGSKFRLASGKAPRYPREPTLGAFLEGAEERFDGVNSWEEFRERYNDTEMVFLDYETTGLDFDEFGKATTNGNPTQIGLVRMKNGKEIGRLNLFMNPEQPLGEWSLANLKDADGNPITNEWLATQMPMAEAHRQVAEFIGPDAIIGVQNATFDKRVLEDALEREGIDWRPSGYLDTRDISAMTLPVWSEESPEGPYITDRDGNKKPSSSLAAITEYLDVELGEGHHNADADAFATSQVMQKIIDRAIENGWSTDVLDKEKRDSKLKADNDKFNADAEKFELDKEAFVAERDSVDSASPPPERSRETSEANTVVELNDIFKRPLRPIRRSRPTEKLTSTEARLFPEDSLYDEAYGPIRRSGRVRTPQARGIGETEYDAILEMVDFGRRKKKLRKASFSYGPDEFEKTLLWTNDNPNREVDIKIMSQELEVPLSNAYFFINEFPEIFERLKSENKRRQKYRIRTPQEIKNYSEESSRLSSGARAKRSIPSMSEIRQEVERQYVTSEMSDAELVRMYLKERTYDANRLYESRHIDDRSSDEVGEHFTRFRDFIDNEEIWIGGMSDTEILEIFKTGKYNSTIDSYNKAIDNIGPVPSKESSRLASGATKIINGNENAKKANISFDVRDEDPIDDEDLRFFDSEGNYDFEAYSEAVDEKEDEIVKYLSSLTSDVIKSSKLISDKKYPDAGPPQRFQEAKIQIEKAIPKPSDRGTGYMPPLVIARDSDGNIVGLARFDRNDNSVFIDHIGSYGQENGTADLGASVFGKIVDIAAAQDSPIILESTPGSEKYWRSLGFYDIDEEGIILNGNKFLTMSEEDVRKLSKESRLSSGETNVREGFASRSTGVAGKNVNRISRELDLSDKELQILLEDKLAGSIATISEDLETIPIHSKLEKSKKRLLNSIRIEVGDDGVPIIMADPSPLLFQFIPDKRDWSKVRVPQRETIKKAAAYIKQNQSEEMSGERLLRSVMKADSELEKFASRLLDLLETTSEGAVKPESSSPYLNASWTSLYLASLADPIRASYIGTDELVDEIHDAFGHAAIGRGFDRHGEWANPLAIISMLNHSAFDDFSAEAKEDIKRFELREFAITRFGQAYDNTYNNYDEDLEVRAWTNWVTGYTGDIQTVIDMLDDSDKTQVLNDDGSPKVARLSSGFTPLSRATNSDIYAIAKQELVHERERNNRLSSGAWIPEEFDISKDEVIEISKGRNAATAPQARDSQKLQIIILPKADNVTDNRYSVYAQLEIEGGGKLKPGKPTGRIVITGDGVDTGRPIENPDGSTSPNKPSKRRVNDQGIYREAIEAAIINLDLQDKVKPIKNAESGLRADAKRRPYDGFIIEGATLEESAEILNQLGKELLSEAREGNARRKAAEALKEEAKLLKEERDATRKAARLLKSGGLTEEQGDAVREAVRLFKNKEVLTKEQRAAKREARREELRVIGDDARLLKEEREARIEALTLFRREIGRVFKEERDEARRILKEERDEARRILRDEARRILKEERDEARRILKEERDARRPFKGRREAVRPEEGRLSSGANVAEAFNEPIEVTRQESIEAGSSIETLAGKKVAERIIQKIEETTGTKLNDQQKRTIENNVPGLTLEIADKTLLDIEIDDAFSETGKQLLESISIDISSDGIPFVSADPIPQLAEQIPDKRDWRTVELPKRDDVLSILEEAMKDTVVFSVSPDEGITWKDTDGNIVARRGDRDGDSYLKYESDEARTRFPMLEMIAPKGTLIRNSSISLPSLNQDTLPAPYIEAWKKHGQFLRELSRRAGELMGDEELFVYGISNTTSTYLRGYIGGITDPNKFNMGLNGRALQASHDLFGHLGTGRAFDRHGEWANDLAMMSIVDHPDSPLTLQEKMVAKHLIYMMYSSNRMLKVGRLDEQEKNEKESETFLNQPRHVFDIYDLDGTAKTEIRVYAGDFGSIIKKFDAASTSKRLSSGRKSIYEADAKDVELALAHDVLGKNDRLSSGRVRESIPMNVPSKREQEGPSATGYGTEGSSGKIVRRDSSTWLSGLNSDEISRVIIPANAEEYFEMWADDIAGPTWRTDKNRETFIKKYYAELQKDSTNIPVDYSPESIAATQKLVKDLLDSSPSVMWVMQNFGAPLIVPFTREGMDAYENSPDVKERLALLAKQRGTEKIPFVSGLANRSLGSIGISPRALIDRESLLNDDKGVYPISFDPDRVPAPRDAHIDRSLEGTLVHEFGHWIHHRALWDTETNGASGKMRSYYGTGKLSDPRYVASLDVAEEYGDYETDDKRIEIYSQFIDLTGRSPEEMFRAHPDEPLLSTSYGNINKREAIAEAFVAIMHPNKEMPEKTLSKKLRKDIYTLIGVDEKDLPWSDSETGSENRLSSGAKKGKRKNIFSRFRKEETEEETVEEIVEEKRKPPVVERPEGLVSFAPEPSQELLKASPIPDEETLRDEVLKDVQALALEFDGVQEPELFGSGTKASALAKKTIAANLSRSVDFDVQEFINVFATDKAGHGFHTTETFAAVQKLYKTLENLPVDATGTQRRAAARAAFDTKSGRVIAAKIHDDILDRARYYDEILDKLETEEFDELFGDSFDELMATDGGEKSLFTPYLMTKLGTIDIRREFLEEIEPRRGLLNRLIEAVTLIEDKAFGLAKIGEINPNTGERDYEIISLLGRPVSSKAIDAMSSLDINDKDYLKKLSDIMPEFKYQLTLEKLKEIVESEIVKVDSSSINSPEVQKALKEHLLRNVRSRAGNYDSKLESYTKETGVVFFDVETTEGKRIVREALVSDLIHTWAISANNANPVALSIQHEIRKMFGLDEAVGWSTSPIRARRLDEKEGMPAHEFDGAPELNDTQSAMIKLVLQKIYDSTQLYYKTKGITHIPVYRGFTQSDTNLLPGEIESMDTIMRPLSSWATSMDVASTFSGVHNTRVGTPTLIKAFVPVEDVFSNALTGFGCLNEDEVVLFGKPMRVLAVRMDSIQPESVGSIEKPTLLEILKDVNIANIDKAFESIAQRRETLLDNSDLIEELFNSGSDLRGMDLRNTLLDDKKLAGANLAGANMQYSRLNRIDLSNADLTGAVLEDTNLFMANLSGANLTDADLARANMLQANLTGANLTGASMIKASMKETDLTGANLTRASMKDADLTGAKLVDADLTEANLTGADLFLANLEGVNLEGANLNLTQLASANLQNANMRRAILVGANLLGADLRGADLSNANMTNITLLRGANLEGANLSGANLQGADLADVNLTGANLTGANLEGAKLQGANLDGVKLDGANLTGAILFSAKLKGASLKLANLHKANLRGADLEGVDLRGLMMVHAKLDFAVLTDANLDGADLFGVQFEDANLTRATLKGARMASVYLLNANLTGADLTGVELRDSVLRGANLTDANLTGADLSRTKLDGANLTGAKMPEGYIPTNDQPVESVQKLSSGKKSHTPKWKTVEEIVDFEVLGASPDDSEEDRDDIVKESVGEDWMQWDPCREIRTAAYELAGIDEYSERDPNISQSGGFFGNSKFQTAVSPEKRTEQARYLMASVVDSLINGRKYDRQPYLYRAMMFSSPEEGKQFFDTMQVGSQVDIPLLAFVEIGPSPRGDHFLTRFGSDALLVLEDFPGSYQTGGNFEPVYSNRHESDTLYNINEFAEAILADIENGEVDEENAEYDKEFAEKLIKLVEDYREAKTPLEKSNIKIDIEEALDEVGNETIQREWEGEQVPVNSREYFEAIEDEDTGMTPREFISGGRLEVVSVKPDTSKAYRQIITLRQVGAFDPQEKGALVLKTDGENSTRLSSGKKPAKKAKPKSVQLKDDEFEKKFNQKVPEGNGDCFSEAIQQARKLAEAYDKVKIVHGYPLGTGGEAEGLRFPHAWAEFERDGLVWVRDYSNGNRFEFPQILYYSIGNIEEADVSRYDIKEAEANMIENEHYGPW